MHFQMKNKEQGKSLLFSTNMYPDPFRLYMRVAIDPCNNHKYKSAHNKGILYSF